MRIIAFRLRTRHHRTDPSARFGTQMRCAGTALLASAVIVAGCTPSAERTSSAPTMASSLRVDSLAAPPVEPGAAEPFLSRTPDGRVLLSWLQRMPDSTTSLRLAILSTDGRWSEAREITRRSDLFVNWADFPSVVALADGRLLAHWLQRNGGGRYAYDVRLSQSVDSGRTWTPSVIPHEAGVQAEHGFVTLLPRTDSTADLVFLNGQAAPATHAAGDHAEEHGPPMRLGAARWDAQGRVVPAGIIDARVCDCCQTAAAVTSHGPIVLYRDRSDANVRDIGVVRSVNGAWTSPAPLHRDGWVIDGCPVNGPAVSAAGERVAAVWFTGARDSAKVQLVFSDDAGATFGSPVRIDAGAPAGRVDTELLANGDAVVTWLERSDSSAASVRARRVRRDGVALPSIAVATTLGSRPSGFPRMVRDGDGVVVAWTEPGAMSVVRVARVRTTQ
jgi:hypothetical protein